jgi:putative ABC transport system permease protein
MTGLTQDFHYAFRRMTRSPMLTLAVVLTVALAIAANTSIFSFVNAVMLRPLPYRDPARLIQVSEKNDKLSLPTFGASVLNFLSWREQTQTIQDLSAVGFANFTLTGSGDPEQVSGNLISPSLTRMLGIDLIAGRAFSDDEEKPGSPAVAMIGEGFWKRRFGADRGLVGRTIILNDTPTTVVGIAPTSLNLISGADVYTPLTIDPAKEIRLNHVIVTFGRLKPGVRLQQAQAEMDTIAKNVGQQFPEVRDWGIHILSLFDTFVSPQLKTGLWVLLAAVLFVLLIACANIANLLLSRASARQQEMAVRTANGASRSRLMRQLLVESVTLSIVGGIAGLVGAFGAVRAINHSLPVGTLPVPEVPMDSRVLWFAIAAMIGTGLLFGIAPSWRLAKVDLNEVLKQGGRGAAGARSRLRNGLVATELALATMLLIGAGLLIRTLGNLERVQLGFEPSGLITFQLAPPAAKYPGTGKAQQFYRELLAALQSTPGVRGAAISSGIPFGAGNYNTHPMLTTDRSVLPPGTHVPIDWRIVSPGYFKMMNIPMLRGRDFTDADAPPSPLVTIISEATAKKFWGDEDPIGHTLRRSADPKTPFTVVGVVGDVRSTALNQESPALYYPSAWQAAGLTDVAVRAVGDPNALLPSIRQKIHGMDPELALANVKTMDEWISNSAAQPRLNARLLAIFATMALVIAAIGIYAVLAYSVAQRTREIGLRIALGAMPGRVIGLVMGEGMKVGLIGIGIGLVGALAIGRVMASLLYGVPLRDPATFALVAVVLMLVALAACYIPGRRAAKVNPMVALRYE